MLPDTQVSAQQSEVFFFTVSPTRISLFLEQGNLFYSLFKVLPQDPIQSSAYNPKNKCEPRCPITRFNSASCGCLFSIDKNSGM